MAPGLVRLAGYGPGVVLFDGLEAGGHEQVVLCHDAATGLRAIIAVHSTVLGPGLGGTRFRAYASDEEALDDVLRLSRGMTYKNAAAGLDLGGGKAVIIGEPRGLRSEGLIRAYGRFVHSLNGRYRTAEDVGTTQADMDLVRRETPYVTGTSLSLGGSGDPSPATALGCTHAMRAVAERLWGDPDLGGRHVVVSGVGKVGSALVGHLVEAGARVTVADVVDAAVRRVVDRHGVDAVAVDDVHAVPCDIYAPCALGGVLNERTIPELRCAAVVGSANNQLAEEADAKRIADAGVLYAPDFVVNAGGVINIAEELRGYDGERARAALARIHDNTAAVLDTAEAEGLTTAEAAERVAERRIEAMASVQRIRAEAPGRG
jgi:glutamate dehydrogenase/leucine dehydrogenase